MDNYNNLDIKSFDMLLSTTTTPFSQLIKFCQSVSNKVSHNYSHIALILKGDVFPNNAVIDGYKINKEKFYLFESVIYTKDECPNIFGQYYNGSQLRDFDIVMNSYNQHIKLKSMERVGLAKLNIKTRKIIDEYFALEENKQKFLKIIKGLLNINYNFNLIDQSYIPFHNYALIRLLKQLSDLMYKKKEKTYVCSELMGELFKQIGLLKENTNIHFILPEDFLPKSNDVNETETCDIDNEVELFYEFPASI